VRNSSVSMEVREGGGRGGAPGAREEIPLHLLEKTMVDQGPSKNCGPWEVHTGAGEKCEDKG